MSKPSQSYDPKQERLFSAGKRRGQLVPALQFHCALCNAMTVRTPGELCSKCRGPVQAGRSR